MSSNGRAYIEHTGDHEPARERPIDLVHLARQTLGDRNLEVEILQMFEQISHTYIARVKAPENSEDLEISIHSLKGAAAGVGANSIATIAALAETELRDQGKIESETLADLEFAVAEVNTFIQNLLAS